MKKIILFFITSVLLSSLYGDMISMDAFRKEQRRLVLSDFKALYKQRHLSAHKAQLRHKYTRVKKVSHSGVLDFYHHTTTQTDSTDMLEEATLMPQETHNVSMQTEANHDLENMDTNYNDSNPYTPDFGLDDSTMGNENQNQNHTPESKPENGGSNDMPENTAGGDNNGYTPESHPDNDGGGSIPENVAGGDNNAYTPESHPDNGGGGSIPENVAGNDNTYTPETPPNNDGGGNIPENVAEGDNNNYTPESKPEDTGISSNTIEGDNGNYTQEVTPDNGANIEIPENNSNTDNQESPSNPNVSPEENRPFTRSLYANPWRRR